MVRGAIITTVASLLLAAGNLFGPGGGTASAQTTQKPFYAAMGDSVASGAGLPYANPSNQDVPCGRSDHSYPYFISNATRVPLVHAACSGALAGDLFTRQDVDGPNIAPQLDTVFAYGKPQFISITAGANDVHWDEFIRQCYARTCGGDFDKALAKFYQSWLEYKLYYLLVDIQSRSGNAPPPVVLTGYYAPVSRACAANQRQVTASEIAWLQESLNQLNQSLQKISLQFSFARFVQPDFTGHDFCSATPWVQGFNDKAPFHPNRAGHDAIGKSVLRALGYQVND